MKGIVAEIHRNHMIVIAKNGDFIKCKKLPNCDIGDEINIPKTGMAVVYKRFSAMAASLIIIAMLFTGVYAYYTPYSYISVDINPSLELYVNRFDRVIEVHAFNEDAQKVLEASKGIKNKNVNAVLEKILDSAADAGYIKEEDENSVMIVVSSNSKKAEADLTQKVSQTSTKVLSNITDNYEIILEKAKVETYIKAKEENVSPGKVILAHQLKEVKPEIDEEKIKHMPLKQAIKEIEEKDEEKDIEDKNAETEKPAMSIATASGEKSDSKNSKKETKNNVMNIRELIKEKNKELAKRLQEIEKEKEKAKENNKDKNNSKDKDKKESQEKLNQDNKNNKENKNQNNNKWNQKDNNNQDQKKNNNQNKYDKNDNNKNQNNKWDDRDKDNNKWRNGDKDD